MCGVCKRVAKCTNDCMPDPSGKKGQQPTFTAYKMLFFIPDMTQTMKT